MQVSPAMNQSVWKQAFQNAVFESDPIRIQPKLEAAQKAIEDRLSELRAGVSDHRELMELEYAKCTISFLAEEEQKT
ncbi:MAG: hypothetical protein DMG97_19055 [Acidobacteria bacterium]|nr:MAG: hypothetical protein DMG97_19055 [Acidobacteriota bacterium]